MHLRPLDTWVVPYFLFLKKELGENFLPLEQRIQCIQKEKSDEANFVVITLTWVVSFTFYVALIVPQNGYYFDPTSFPICKPFYTTNNVAIIAACVFYFPPTLVLLYSYGSVFQLAKSKTSRLQVSTSGLSSSRVRR
ncbi:unnamed protein product, partial [Cyprideis torosa]